MSTVGLFEEFIDCVAEACRSVYGQRLVSLVVFGSVGRGRARPDSDLDLLLIAQDLPPGRMKRVSEFDRVERALAPALKRAKQAGLTTYLSPILKTPAEAERGSPLFLDMVEDARLVIDQDGFFAGVLGRLKEKMRKLGSRRVWRGTRWYWVLKPDLKPGEVVEL